MAILNIINKNNMEQIIDFDKEQRRQAQRRYVNAYNSNHRKEISKQVMENHKNNPDWYNYLKQPYSCPCGSEILFWSKSRHQHSNKHRQFLNTDNLQ